MLLFDSEQENKTCPPVEHGHLLSHSCQLPVGSVHLLLIGPLSPSALHPPVGLFQDLQVLLPPPLPSKPPSSLLLPPPPSQLTPVRPLIRILSPGKCIVTGG